MSLTAFQKDVLRLLATSRLKMEGAYVAGGTALNLATEGRRLSRDVDLFHDSGEALVQCWRLDQKLLLGAGYDVDILRERPTFVEAMISRDRERTAVQWVVDSACRYFPLRRDPLLGATLHPVDLATNKILALVGRHEVRDWVDTIQAAGHVQPLALLLWAAVGKDPGYSVDSLFAAVSRARFSAFELSTLDFEPPRPDFAVLSRTWRGMLAEVRPVIDLLPTEKTGTCVCCADGRPFGGAGPSLEALARFGGLTFRPPSIRGTWPEMGG